MGAIFSPNCSVAYAKTLFVMNVSRLSLRTQLVTSLHRPGYMLAAWDGEAQVQLAMPRALITSRKPVVTYAPPSPELRTFRSPYWFRLPFGRMVKVLSPTNTRSPRWSVTAKVSGFGLVTIIGFPVWLSGVSVVR